MMFQASYGRREIEIAEQEMPGIMALRKKASVSFINCDHLFYRSIKTPSVHILS